jgi:fructokinase
VAWDHIEARPELITEVEKSRAIVFGSLVSRNEFTRQTLLRLLETDLLKIMDVNLRPPFDKEDVVKMLLEHADIVKLNDDEMIRISDWYALPGTLRERMEAFRRQYNLSTLIVTRGKNGACLIHNGVYHEHNGYRVQTVDTVGSGDAFLAGFLAALFDGKEMPLALTEACAVGAFVATRAGATPEYSRADIMGMIAP